MLKTIDSSIAQKNFLVFEEKSILLECFFFMARVPNGKNRSPSVGNCVTLIYTKENCTKYCFFFLNNNSLY